MVLVCGHGDATLAGTPDGRAPSFGGMPDEDASSVRIPDGFRAVGSRAVAGRVRTESAPAERRRRGGA